MPASTQLCHLGMVGIGIHPWWTRGEGRQLAPKGLILPSSFLTSEGNTQCPQRCTHRCTIRDRRLVQPATHTERFSLPIRQRGLVASKMCERTTFQREGFNYHCWWFHLWSCLLLWKIPQVKWVKFCRVALPLMQNTHTHTHTHELMPNRNALAESFCFLLEGLGFLCVLGGCFLGFLRSGNPLDSC